MTEILDWLADAGPKCLDAIYAATIMTAGLAPGLVAFFVNLWTPLWSRWIVTLIMLFTTIYAAVGPEYYYTGYLVGCGVYVLCATGGLYTRAAGKAEDIIKLYPCDLVVFVIGVVILSLLYRWPPMCW